MTTMNKSSLLDAIERKRSESSLSHAEVARLIGMLQPHWASVRNGDRKITRRALRQIRSVWPDLDPLVDKYAAAKSLGELD